MKTSPSAILTLLLLSHSASLGQLPQGTSIHLTRMADPGAMQMTFDDPGNRNWSVQFSTNLRDWHDFRAVTVHNSLFRVDLPRFEDAPRAFYRAVLRPGDTSGSSTPDDALLLPASPANYADPEFPLHLLAPPVAAQDNTPPVNPTTDAGATLGRVLFYDRRLSANNRVSCASCHQQAHGFSDPDRFSTGFEGRRTSRNSMGLTSARFYQRGHFFWDERAATLEEQVLAPIQNEIEMGLSLPELVTRISAESLYPSLFTAAFGDPDVTTDRIARALAQFVRSIVSVDTKYDRGRASNFTNFTAQENLGRGLFNGRARCSTCHGTDNFVPNDVFNIGLENPYRDPGVGAITGRTQDVGKFKVPSLRNVALTAPYMHDGRFSSLDEVVEFYNSRITDHPNLAPQLREGPPPQPGQPPQPGRPVRLNLTATERAALVAFLRTLTDAGIATDPRFSDPFNYGDQP